ncbi:MAG TPA: hypothetical protein DCX89_03310 [Saprospirales bacterium]|nr:hypothetical protein [Saprospirales bacterium]HRQ28943.1 T9SS type A sorting domain-containing protein [Saprospiraceae bacterium]
MKKLFTFSFLLILNLSFGQGLETFTNIPTSSASSYLIRNWTGDNSVSWTATDARTDQTINGKAITIRNGYLESQANISGGVGSITLTTQRKFGNATEDGNLTVYVNNNSVGTVPYSGTATTTTISNINVSGPITIKVSKEGNAYRCAIDDLTWTTYIVSSNDNDSEVDGPSPSSQPDPIFISSLNDSDGESVKVFDFDIYDYGSGDGVPTIVLLTTIKSGSNNTANWLNSIGGAKLSLDGGTTFVTTATPVITSDNNIIFTIPSGNLEISDGDGETVSLFIYLKNTGLIDNSIFEFTVSATTHGFVADGSGSQFANTMGGAVSNQILLDVEASELRFVQQPSSTNVNVAMSPAVTVEASDVNGNRDLDFTSSISITSSGTLTGSPVTVAASNGLATFSSLTHTVLGTGLTLNAERNGTGDWDEQSNTFNIITLPTVDDVRINEVDSDTPGTDAAEFVELFGTPNFDLSGLVVVFFNGNGDISYYAADLDGFNLDENGYFILGNSGGSFTPDIPFSGNTLQNGADAVALYYANATNFPNGTAVTSVNLIDALVYDSDDADDSGLLSGLNQVEQINENANGNIETESIQRGSWFVASPTPRGENTLPVEMLGLTIEVKQKYAALSWKTATEVNASHFEIERATEANLFKGIGKVLASGNSSEVKSYTYTDEKPVKGNNYYRLKMIDNDGTYRYSEVVSAHFGNTNTGLILTPNLVHSSLKISFEAPVENGRVLIYNLDGKLVQSYLLAEGIDVLRVDVSDLVSGQYVIQYQSNQGNETVRFVKE